MKDMEAPADSRSERRDAAENRLRILEAARRLFEQKGVEHVSMNQIAAEAQVGSGTLYRRYKNKSDLCLDVIKENIDLFFNDVEEYLEKNRADPPGERLRGIIRFFIRFREKKAQLLAGVEDLSANRPRSGAPSPLYNKLHQFLVDLFDEMAPAGESRPISVFKADMVLAALRSEPYFFQRDVRGLSPDMILDHLISTFISPK